MHSLAGIDLNLVVALHALLEERSVTAAARRIGLSQPAASHALSRLREHFGDPLLIRSGRAMVPTPRAQALTGEVRRVVGELERLLSTVEVAPEALQIDFRLATDDYVGATLLPRLVGRLAELAPGVSLDVLPRGVPGRKALLRQGKVDLAVGYFSGAGMDLHRAHLYDDDWVCVLRRGHPALAVPFTAEVWAGLSHVIVSPTGGRRGEVDTALQRRGLVRRVAYAVPHFATALALVAATDCVLAVGQRLAEVLAEAHGLALLPPPLLLPAFPVSMLWHARTEHDPAQRWLRGLVASVAAG